MEQFGDPKNNQKGLPVLSIGQFGKAKGGKRLPKGESYADCATNYPYYRNKKDAKPTLQSVLALCIGLNLHPSFSYDLIAKAGYNIMIASEEFLIYRYLIEHHHMENIFMWNAKLQDAGISQQLPKNGNKMTAPEK